MKIWACKNCAFCSFGSEFANTHESVFGHELIQVTLAEALAVPIEEKSNDA